MNNILTWIFVRRQHILHIECLVLQTIPVKTIFTALFILCTSALVAQRTNRHTPVIKKGVYLSLNPYSILEPEQGAAGIGIGYRLNKRIELFSEMACLYRGFFMEDENFWKLKGFRLILSGKYFYQNKYGFFVGAEIRWKRYSFTDENTFVRASSPDTLSNYRYRPRHELFGGGVFWGKRFKLTPNGKWELEGNIGIGVKYRHIIRNGVPDGYEKIEYLEKDRILILPDRDVDQVLPYVPATLRILYHF